MDIKAVRKQAYDYLRLEASRVLLVFAGLATLVVSASELWLTSDLSFFDRIDTVEVVIMSIAIAFLSLFVGHRYNW